MGHHKYGYSESAATQYYSDSQSYEIYDHNAGIDEYSRTVSDFPSNDQTTMTNQQSERSSNTNVITSNRDCKFYTSLGDLASALGLVSAFRVNCKIAFISKDAYFGLFISLETLIIGNEWENIVLDLPGKEHY